MTKPVYYQVEQRVCGAWSPTEDGRIILLSGSFRDLLDTVNVTDYQRIRKLDPDKLPSDWTPKHVYSKMLRRVLDHQKEWAKLSWWRRVVYHACPLFNPNITFVKLVTTAETYRHTCRSEATERATYLRLFHRLDDAGTYDEVPDYLTAWRDKAREGDSNAACRLLVCRSEQGHDSEFLDVYWSNYGTQH
jgi:hypothetical protein